MSIQLTENQRAVVEDRGGSLLVSAAAGSGKTRVLVERLFLRVLGEEQANIDDFLIITYTRAAAAELRGRIAPELTPPHTDRPRGRPHLPSPPPGQPPGQHGGVGGGEGLRDFWDST